MFKRITATLAVGVAATLGILTIASCGSDDKPTGQKTGQQIAAERTNYSPVNDVEGKNYNGRLRYADDPAQILWCTAYPTSPSAKAFTVPIVGKLTSSNKRPYATSKVRIDTDTPGSEYNPEVAGPDGMFGTSGDYRYGFDPGGNYHEFSNSLEMHCTNVPDVIQKETTQLAITAEGDTTVLDRRAQEALRKCQASNPKDPNLTSQPCAEAARILGL